MTGRTRRAKIGSCDGKEFGEDQEFGPKQQGWKRKTSLQEHTEHTQSTHRAQRRSMSSSITSFFAPKAGTNKAKGKRSHNDSKDSVDGNKKRKTAPLSPAVEQLLSHLHDDGWKDALKSYTSGPAFAKLAEAVAKERYVRNQEMNKQTGRTQKARRRDRVVPLASFVVAIAVATTMIFTRLRSLPHTFRLISSLLSPISSLLYCTNHQIHCQSLSSGRGYVQCIEPHTTEQGQGRRRWAGSVSRSRPGSRFVLFGPQGREGPTVTAQHVQGTRQRSKSGLSP